MNKDQYFKDLQEIIYDSIFVGESRDELTKEIQSNMWRISITNKLSRDVTVNDFVDFFNSVIENRQEQIDKCGRSMIFYLWFDWMAAQLRFNLISALHEELPFQCTLNHVSSMNEIFEDFLLFPYHEGLPISDEDNSVDEEENPYTLKIYKTTIKPRMN